MTENDNYQHDLTFYMSACGICALAYIVMKIAKPKEPTNQATNDYTSTRLADLKNAAVTQSRQINDFHNRHPV